MYCSYAEYCIAAVETTEVSLERCATAVVTMHRRPVNGTGSPQSDTFILQSDTFILQSDALILQSVPVACWRQWKTATVTRSHCSTGHLWRRRSSKGTSGLIPVNVYLCYRVWF